MHIISGKYQRRSLKFPKDRSFRPTKSVVRESVFNIIGDRIEGASFLDLFSGSGGMGLEAESRGASLVVCVDRRVNYLVENKKSLDATIDIVSQQVVPYLKTTSQVFDFIYLDPVWRDRDSYSLCIQIIYDRLLLNANGWLLVEHDSGVEPMPIFGNIREYKYGNSKISIMVNGK